MDETHVWVTDHRTGHQYPAARVYADSLPDDLEQHPERDVRDTDGRLLDPVLNTEDAEPDQPAPDPEPQPYTGFTNPEEG